MTTRIAIVTLIAALGLSLQAATPEQEKTFVDSYKKALEANDAAALKGFLLTEGADKEAIELFSMMQSMSAGGKIAKIELLPLTKEEVEKSKGTMPGPSGKLYKMPSMPVKALSIEMELKEGTSKNSHRVPIGEVKGKLGILVPVPAK